MNHSILDAQYLYFNPPEHKGLRQLALKKISKIILPNVIATLNSLCISWGKGYARYLHPDGSQDQCCYC